jgi:hypothetical protein
MGSVALVAVGAVFIAALGVTAYARDRSGDPGVTTEIALLLAFLIGVLCSHDQMLAAALAVAVTVLLAARDTLHQFSRNWLQPGEVRSGLILAALFCWWRRWFPLILWGAAQSPVLMRRCWCCWSSRASRMWGGARKRAGDGAVGLLRGLCRARPPLPAWAWRCARAG